MLTIIGMFGMLVFMFIGSFKRDKKNFKTAAILQSISSAFVALALIDVIFISSTLSVFLLVIMSLNLILGIVLVWMDLDLHALQVKSETLDKEIEALKELK